MNKPWHVLSTTKSCLWTLKTVKELSPELIQYVSETYMTYGEALNHTRSQYSWAKFYIWKEVR